MNQVQDLLDPGLKALGFRRRQRTYNRQSEPGLVQVLDFQMGRSDPPRRSPSPVPAELKHDLRGKFTVNAGIYVKEVTDTRAPVKGSFVIEPSCMIRVRLGRLLAPPAFDLWWPLERDAALLAAELRPAIFSKAVPFLERFATRSAIISEYLEAREIPKPPRARIDVGIILMHMGLRDRAVALFRDHLRDPHTNPVHRSYVLTLAKQLGIGGVE